MKIMTTTHSCKMHTYKCIYKWKWNEHQKSLSFFFLICWCCCGGGCISLSLPLSLSIDWLWLWMALFIHSEDIIFIQIDTGIAEREPASEWVMAKAYTMETEGDSSQAKRTRERTHTSHNKTSRSGKLSRTNYHKQRPETPNQNVRQNKSIITTTTSTRGGSGSISGIDWGWHSKIKK